MARAAKKKTVKARKKAVRKPTNGKLPVAKKRKAPAKKRAIKGKGITIVRQTSVARKTNGKPPSQKQIIKDILGMAQEGLDGFDAGDLRAARRNLRFIIDTLSAK